MYRSPKIITISFCLLFLYSGCSRGIYHKGMYQPPRLGAESRFEEGLRWQKRPQQLFSPKDRKEMLKMGMLSVQGQRPASATTISPATADSLLTGKRDSVSAPHADSTSTTRTDTIPPKKAL